MLLRRIGIIGDVHTEDRRLAHALHVLQSSGVEAILCVGDIVDGMGSVDRCCELLRAHDVICVRGNHERWFLGDTMRDLPDATPIGGLAAAERAFIASLPATRTLDTADGALLLCHGLGDDDMATVKPDDHGYSLDVNDALNALVLEARHRYVVAGHSHKRMVKKFGEITIVNAGTLYRDHDPCFGLIDFTERHVEFFRADVSPGKALIEQLALPR